MLNKNIIRTEENIKEILRKLRHKTHPQSNPKNLYTVNKIQYEEYFKFSILRNPWERLYSWYRNVIRDEGHLKRFDIEATITFEDFIKKIYRKEFSKTSSLLVKKL